MHVNLILDIRHGRNTSILSLNVESTVMFSEDQSKTVHFGSSYFADRHTHKRTTLLALPKQQQKTVDVGSLNFTDE